LTGRLLFPKTGGGWGEFFYPKGEGKKIPPTPRLPFSAALLKGAVWGLDIVPPVPRSWLSGAISASGVITMFEDEDFEQETRAGIEARIQRLPAVTSHRVRTGKAAPGHKPYTPQFSNRATVTVRRLAWALQVSMPKAVDRAVAMLPSVFPSSLVCPLCKDNTKCTLCAFNQSAATEQAAPSV
jgi:hypothetical protein